MKLFSGGRSLVRVVLAGALIACVPLCQAQSAPHLDKHARKIHHKLAKYPSGQYLHLMLRNSTDAYGALGELAPASFTFINADSNAAATYSYAEVDRIRTNKEAIGTGTAPRRHFRHLVPIVICVAAAGAAAAVVVAER
jgi:hypothetical protein